MVFGLFKKDRSADTIFVNGKIYTQDREHPWAEAAACKDGKFICVGDNQDALEYEGSDTYVIDLGGKYVLPGLINTHNHVARRIFQGLYLPLSENQDIDDVLGALCDYMEENPEEEVYFAYGFREDLLVELTQEEASLRLDEISQEKALVLLSLGEQVLWVNNLALEQARAAAQEDGMLTISVPYFMETVAPFPYEELQNRTIELAAEYCARGFTSLLDAGAPLFMDRVYQEMLLTMHQQELMKQRYFGCLEVVGSVMGRRETVMKRLVQKKTHATELDELIHCDILKLHVGGEGISDMVPVERIQELCLEASDRGFDVHVDALDRQAFQDCMEMVTEIRHKGYRKNRFIVASEEAYRQDSGNFNFRDMGTENVFFQPSTRREPEYEYGAMEEAKSIEEVIDLYTLDAAAALGMGHKLGAVQAGMLADLAVFDKNPLELAGPGLFKKLEADMTVVSGQVVYDGEEETMQEWYDLMSGMQL
ncbi:amidohydrolase family protein [Aminipila butyrica]|uniref:Amidohydrolase family protein n=1 Tax=Aminipila butyrica TaxID=433296 RepID=A0A858BTI7_9FIRM|nr:amidohydrolase family protein [Aminipila butyrica]QIB68084.1 amidohydrolase family protein [Aminipila butyrica]